jgi:flagellar L-ring protein precursor FlgH
MANMTRSPLAAALLVALSLTALSGCNILTRIDDIGSEPPLTAIENPVRVPGYAPVTLPMPRPEQMARQANSLWRPGARAFFKDQRAARVGDILTVNIDIEDEATISNTSQRSRQNSEDANLTNFFGVESELGKLLPDGIDPSSVVDFGSSTSNTGAGSVNRNEEINLIVAALITQVLPNGNLVIQGRQEVRVNFEVRELSITGVVRPEDISSGNTINHSQIAEARISYGGRGQISDVQQPRYGQQLFDIVMPF